MDLGTVIGIASGIILLLASILMNAGLSNFIDIPSLLVVVGGSAAAILISFSLKDTLNTIAVIKKVFFHQESDVNKIVQDFVGFAAIIRKDGPQKLEKVPTDDPLIKKALQLIADGASEENIDQILTIEKDAMYDRHSIGRELMEAAGDYLPAFGMIGTMIGLVVMLLNLDDPSTIGPSMSVALITTFYGAVFANLFAIPIAKKLEQRSKGEMLNLDLVIQGAIALRKAENPRVMEEKLLGYIHPSLRVAGDGK